MDVERNTYNIQEVGLAKALVRKGHICDIVFWTDKEEKNITITVKGYGNVNVFYRHGKTALKNTVYTNCAESLITESGCRYSLQRSLLS